MNKIALRLPLSDFDTCFESAKAAIESGGLAIYPTDTLYGIGCDAENAEAVARLRKLKGRDSKKPLSIIVSDLEMAESYCSISPKQKNILLSLLPGPYTFILPLKKPLPVSDTPEIGIRVPEHHFMRAVSKALSKPIVSTSANLSGEKEAADASEVPRAISDGADIFIDGGKCRYAQGSTVIDLIRMKVLRRGAVRQGDKIEWE